MKNKNSSLWLSGLLTGAVLGYYLYKNRDKMPEQKEKMKNKKHNKNSVSKYACIRITCTNHVIKTQNRNRTRTTNQKNRSQT